MKATVKELRRIMTSWTGDSRRGAALIITILVIMVLSLIGMASLAFTETEERAATAYRDQLQAQAVAEAGVRVVQQMFLASNRPAGDRNLVPVYSNTTIPPTLGGPYDYNGTNEAETEASLNSIGIFRRARAGANPARYTGNSRRLFKGPFISNGWEEFFGGTWSATAASNNYDLLFSCTTPPLSVAVVTDCWLNRKINTMFIVDPDWNLQAGRITQIALYAPPITNNNAYAFASVRVTAEKRDDTGRVVARETVEAVIGNDTTQPAIMADGDIRMESGAQMCGSGCESIHANGNMTIESSAVMGGGDPVVSATGCPTGVTLIGGSSVNPPPKQCADRIEPPRVHPWDLLYRPTGMGPGPQPYYLLTNRPVAGVFTDVDPNNNPAPIDCGPAMQCEDFGLEYDITDPVANVRSTTANDRTAAGPQGCLYRWNGTNQGWVQQACVASGGGTTLDVGAAQFEYFYGNDIIRVNDLDSPAKAAADDNAMAPFHRGKVPTTFFKLRSLQPPAGDVIQGTTFLVDGGLWTSGSTGGARDQAIIPALRISFIVVGTMYLGSSSALDPALANAVLLVSGRDVYMESSLNDAWNTAFCNPTNAPGQALAQQSSVVIAAHEQIQVQSSSKILGIIVAENAINMDNARDTGGYKTFDRNAPPLDKTALHIESSARHSYLCNTPPWPFPTTGAATILSMNSSGR